MKRPHFVTGLIFAGAVAALGVALAKYVAAGRATEELKAAESHRAALHRRIASLEESVKQSEGRAVEAERDNGALKKVAQTMSAPPADGEAVGRGPPRYSAPSATAPAAPPVSEAEKQRLAYELTFAQETARQRKREATQRAELEGEVWKLDPAAKFNRRLVAVEQLTAGGEWAEALRILDQAFAEKPVDLPLADTATRLRSTLDAQRTPLEVTLVSDGATFVSIPAKRGPTNLSPTTVKLAPGNYQVVGRRPGFKDVTTTIQVRNGEAPPTATIICTEPIEQP